LLLVVMVHLLRALGDGLAANVRRLWQVRPVVHVVVVVVVVMVVPVMLRVHPSHGCGCRMVMVPVRVRMRLRLRLRGSHHVLVVVVGRHVRMMDVVHVVVLLLLLLLLHGARRGTRGRPVGHEVVATVVLDVGRLRRRGHEVWTRTESPTEALRLREAAAVATATSAVPAMEHGGTGGTRVPRHGGGLLR
jgi:hypothetical protein